MHNSQLFVSVFLLLLGCGGNDFGTQYFRETEDAGYDVVELDADDDAEGAYPDVATPDAATDVVELDASVDASKDSAHEADAPEPLTDASLPDTWPDVIPDGPDPDACVPVTCSQAGAECGTIDDGCGGTLSCGSCTAPQTCGGGGTPNVCGQTACVPKTCEALGANCGWANDGCGTQVNCGSCPVTQTCGGGGTPNVCGGCVPTTCALENQYCGLLEDGCGNTIDCGPYERGHDPSCDEHPGFPYNWYCPPEQEWAPPPFETGCISTYWPGSYCCTQGD